MMSPEHIEHPYPNEQEKQRILQDTGITNKQLTCWFSNNRKRFWKPKMEKMGKGDVVEAAMGNSLAPHTIDYLKAWMMSPEHIQNPYPTEDEKAEIMAATGIEKKQLTCWFSNNRKRYWKPKIEKIREQYGLSESDALPAALLATAVVTPNTAPAPAMTPATTYAPSPVIQNDFHAAGHSGDDMYTAALPMSNPSSTFPYVDHSAVRPRVDPSGTAIADLPAVLPLEDFSSEIFYDGMNVATEEVSIGEQVDENKRQKLDDVVAV